MKKNRQVIVDDHYDVLELLKYNFIKESYAVKFFFTAVDALKYITNENTDLIVTDWMLSEIDDLALCKNLKLSAATRDIPLIMLAGKNEEIDAVTVLEVGADGYLIKTVRVREMPARVKKNLRRKITGEVDTLCSDYYPPAILHSVFKLNKEQGLPLTAAVNPATLSEELQTIF